MLAIVSRACSVVDSIAIDIWARCASLPGQRQCGCCRRLLEDESGEEQQSCCKGGPVQDSTANYSEPHESVFAAKIAPQSLPTDTNVAFYFPLGQSDSGLADYSPTPAFVNLGRYDNSARALLRRPRAKLNRQS